MQTYKMKSHNINEKGFSLIEVVVALFILSISVITIYNLIISTSVSIFKLRVPSKKLHQKILVGN